MPKVKHNPCMLTLFDVTPTGYLDGIFTPLNDYDVPWKDLDIARSLNRMYYYANSGDKIISPMLDKMLVGVDPKVLSSEMLAQTALDAFTLFGSRWARLWEVNQYEYNPGENYNMKETETTDYGKTTKRTDDLTRTQNGKDTQTPDTVQVESNKRYGFNSASGELSDVLETTNKGTIETDYNSSTKDTGTQETGESGRDTRELTRAGNIGVTTTSQMLTEVIELWKWNFFKDVVFKDLDTILTIPIY